MVQALEFLVKVFFGLVAVVLFGTLGVLIFNWILGAWNNTWKGLVIAASGIVAGLIGLVFYLVVLFGGPWVVLQVSQLFTAPRTAAFDVVSCNDDPRMGDPSLRFNLAKSKAGGTCEFDKIVAEPPAPPVVPPAPATTPAPLTVPPTPAPTTAPTLYSRYSIPTDKVILRMGRLLRDGSKLGLEYLVLVPANYNNTLQLWGCIIVDGTEHCDELGNDGLKVVDPEAWIANASSTFPKGSWLNLETMQVWQDDASGKPSGAMWQLIKQYGVVDEPTVWLLDHGIVVNVQLYTKDVEGNFHKVEGATIIRVVKTADFPFTF